MERIRIGGVPEHFNLPWHLAIENGHFNKANIEVEWQTFHGGTGAMTKALRNDEVDMCVVLTEGITADIINGNPSKIIAKYLNTPLIWGVFSGFKNESIQYYGDIYTKRYAISRKGSGSHLMPQIDALSKGHKIQENQFVIIKNLNGAIDSLTNLESDVFYWEKYTTKPYVDNRTFKSLGEYVTPWPSFVLAVTDKALNEKEHTLKQVLDIIHFASDQFMDYNNAVDLVSERYKQKPQDVEQWFYSTEWTTNNIISRKMLQNVIHKLHHAGIIENKVSPEELCYKL